MTMARCPSVTPEGKSCMFMKGHDGSHMTSTGDCWGVADDKCKATKDGRTCMRKFGHVGMHLSQTMDEFVKNLPAVEWHTEVVPRKRTEQR